MNQTVWVAEKICNNFEIDCSFINVVQSEKEYVIVDLNIQISINIFECYIRILYIYIYINK